MYVKQNGRSRCFFQYLVHQGRSGAAKPVREVLPFATLSPQTELTYPKGYGYGVSFPLRLSQEIVLQFMTKAEWEAMSQP
jgi:hypothetical protein